MKIDNVADLIAETLAQAGVKRIFGVVGDSLNGFTEALRKRKAIDWMHVRHEEVAAFAAGAEAQITGELAVCAGAAARATCISSTACSMPPQPRAGAGDRRADPVRRDRRRLFPGDPSGEPVPRMQPLLRAGLPSGADAARAGERDPHGRRPARRRRRRASPATSRCGQRRSAASRRMPGCCRRRRSSAGRSRARLRWPNCSTAASASRCSAAAAAPARMTS